MGYYTSSLLCMPVKNSYEEIIAVAQVNNKNPDKDDGHFTAMDEKVNIANAVTIVIVVDATVRAASEYSNYYILRNNDSERRVDRGIFRNPFDPSRTRIFHDSRTRALHDLKFIFHKFVRFVCALHVKHYYLSSADYLCYRYKMFIFLIRATGIEKN